MKELSQVTALVVDRGLFCEASIRLAKDCKKVYYHVPNDSDPFPTWNASIIGHGMEGVEVVDSVFGPHFKDCDLVVFPDVGMGELQDHIKSLGKAVWGCGMGGELEQDRPYAKEVLESVGLPVGPHKVIRGVKNLRAYLKEHEDQFVKVSRWRGSTESFKSPSYKKVEPHLDEMEFRLGPLKELMVFDVEDALPDKCEVGSDTWSVDGKMPKTFTLGLEVKDECYVTKMQDASQMPKPIQAVDSKLRGILKQFDYRGFLSTEVRVGKDQKPYLIDLTCFDDQTEVLTKSGWKLFRDCEMKDQMATLNIKTKDIEYQHPSMLLKKPYSGKMIEITNRKKTIECLVTPDHDVLRTDRFKKKLFKQKAGKLDDKGYIPRTGNWNPVGCTHFILPEHHHEWDFYGQYGHKVCRRVHHDDAKHIPMMHWAAFLGWYLSEGSCGRGRVSITQSKHRGIVEDVIRNLPFNWKSTKGGFEIHSTQLERYLKPLGLCNEKRVPDHIKSASKEVIVEFLKHYALGDGSCIPRFRGSRNKWYPRGVVYYTTSRGMADDLQELVLKSGSVANIMTHKSKGTVMVSPRAGKTPYIRNHDTYIVSSTIRYNDFWFETSKSRGNQFIKEIDYDGNVYCATVPNGTLYVRRNGKPFWSGNCRHGHPPGFLQMYLLKNYSEIIWKGANGECVEPEFDHPFGVQLQINSVWADKEQWQPIDFDPKFRDQIKMANPCKINGHYYCVPLRFGITACASAVGTGDSFAEASKNAVKAAKTVEGYMMDADEATLDEAIKACDEAKSMGIDMHIS